MLNLKNKTFIKKQQLLFGICLEESFPPIAFPFLHIRDHLIQLTLTTIFQYKL